jgi:hypothetical protein
MKVPRLFRKKRGGKHYGNWLASIKGQDVNLGSKNAEICRKRLRAALKGKRDFAGDAELAADAMEKADVAGAAAPETRPVAQGTTPEGAAAPSTPVLEPELISPGGAPLQLDEAAFLRAAGPANDNARAEAEATNAAAAETSPPAGDAPDPEAPAMPPGVIDGFLKQGAEAIVLAQLQLQGWIIKKRFGRIVQPLTGDGAQKTIDAAAEAWVAQLEVWFPDIKSCPPWLIAVGAPLMLLPAQLETSIPDPDKKPENQAETQPKAAA